MTDPLSLFGCRRCRGTIRWTCSTWVPLTGAEAGYVAAARAANTLRGYRSDWAEFTAWCAQRRLEALPPDPATVTGYLTDLARAGAKVGTMSRRLSAIRFAAGCGTHRTRPRTPG